MNIKNKSDRKSLGTSLIGALIAPFIVLMPITAGPSFAAIDKSQIRFANGICELAEAGYEGTGASDEPYLISDSAALWESSDCSLTGSPLVAAYFELTRDINLTGVTDAPTNSPIGSTTSGTFGRASFSGIVDGKNYGIYGISMSSAVRTVGLFWWLNAAEFRNLSISGTIRYSGETTADGAGGLSGQANTFLIDNVSANVNVEGYRRVGGLVGWTTESVTIQNSTIHGEIVGRSGNNSTDDGTGGMVGSVKGKTTIRNSTAYASVSASWHVGGFLGVANQGAEVDSSKNYGSIKGRASMGTGGFIGNLPGGFFTFSNSINHGEVTGDKAGGFIGINWFNNTAFPAIQSLIETSQNLGTISSLATPSEIGGFIGETDTGIIIRNSTNSGNIIGNNFAGGLIGGHLRPETITNRLISIINTTNEGNVTGQNEVAGLVGRGHINLVSSSRNVGIISGSNYVAGLVGRIYSTTQILGSHNEAAIYGVDYVGGLLGGAHNGVTVSHSINLGRISASNYVGGLVGYVTLSANVNSSKNGGGVSAISASGGLLGIVTQDAKIEFSYNSADITGQFSTGGLAGWIGRDIRSSSSFNAGAVSGESLAGGLIGNLTRNAIITSSYNIGNVAGASEIGGLIGKSAGTSLTLYHVYSAGTVSGVTNVDSIVGLTAGTVTSQSIYVVATSNYSELTAISLLKTKDTYADWDFENTWGFGECSDNLGLPLLRFAELAVTFYSTGCYQPPIPPAITESPTASPSPAPEQSAPGYRGPMIFAFLFPANPGTTAVLDGIRLTGIASVFVGEFPSSFSVISPVSLSVQIPSSMVEGDYDLVILSNDGRLTVVRALRITDPTITIPDPVPVLTDKGRALVGKTQSLPNFQRGQSGLSGLQSNWLQTRLTETGLTRITCTAVIEQSLTMHQKIQARQRAALACQEAKNLLPDAVTKHQSKLTTNKRSVGRVLISFQG